MTKVVRDRAHRGYYRYEPQRERSVIEAENFHLFGEVTA